jgi:hypothetical protein
MMVSGANFAGEVVSIRGLGRAEVSQYSIAYAQASGPLLDADQPSAMMGNVPF